MKKLNKSDAVKVVGGQVVLGGDFEAFAMHNGEVVPADMPGFFPLKQNYVLRNSDAFRPMKKMFADGVQIEVNFQTATCRDGLVGGVCNVIDDALHYAALSRQATLHALSAVRLEQRVIDQGGELSHMCGCNPDFSAYTEVPNKPIEDFAHHPIRTAGFHIQFGLTIQRTREKKFAKLCDRVVGLMAMWADDDESHVMRKADGTGLAGCYRNHPEEGRFEYRTVGSWWLRHPALVHAIYGTARLAANIWKSGMEDMVIDSLKDSEVRSAINNCNRKQCKKLFMKIAPWLNAACTQDPHNSLSCNTKNARGEEIYGLYSRRWALPLTSLVWIAEGNVKFTDNISSFPSQKYGLVNWANENMKGNAKFLEFQKEFIKEIS